MSGLPPRPTAFKPCGECSLCCRLLDAPELEKPPGLWCRHHLHGQGCGIHAVRPDLCRAFQCQWSLSPAVDEAWRPDRCHFILWAQVDGQLLADVDPDFPDAWRAEPFYSQLKSWSAPGRLQVIVRIDKHMFMLFPEADIDMGLQQMEKEIDWGYRTNFDGRRAPYARFVEPRPRPAP